MAGRANLYIGPAGWSYPDWKGRFYPTKTQKSFSELNFLAQHFDFVEINSSYYHPQSAEASKRWLRSVAFNPKFTFSAKLWQKFVLERSHYTSEEVRAVQQGIDVLMEADRFAALLMQFPQSFHNTIDNRSWLFRIVTTFSMYPLVVEVRHQSWDHPEIHDMLRSRSIALANIDQPIVGQGLALKKHITAPFCYFRFHGRNEHMWFHAEATRDSRYDYDYGEAELQQLFIPVNAASKKTNSAYVVFNNHFRGLALKNAFELMFKLSGQKVRIPAELALVYPSLANIKRSHNPEQIELF